MNVTPCNLFTVTITISVRPHILPSSILKPTKESLPQPSSPSSRAVPPLPGAQKTSRTFGDSRSFTAMACSRPPPPTTKTSMAEAAVDVLGRCRLKPKSAGCNVEAEDTGFYYKRRYIKKCWNHLAIVSCSSASSRWQKCFPLTGRAQQEYKWEVC